MRFGKSNGPLLYKVQKEVEDCYQGNDTVAVYYSKLKRLSDHLADLIEIHVCTWDLDCKVIKKIIEVDERKKLMQFLMHLNENYEAIRGQILLWILCLQLVELV